MDNLQGRSDELLDELDSFEIEPLSDEALELVAGGKSTAAMPVAPATVVATSRQVRQTEAELVAGSSQGEPVTFAAICVCPCNRLWHR